MKYFNHIDAKSFQEASEIMRDSKDAVVIAGGTDLLGVLREEILAEHPDLVVNLKSIKGGAYIEENDDFFKIGGLTRLSVIEDSPAIKKRLPILAEAVASVASPIIRSAATISGNICQDVRCWYYRYPHDVGGRMICARKKGGHECYALQGRNQYHSVFGGMKVGTAGCTSNCPAGTDIPAYMEQLRQGNKDAAAAIIMRVNPMPMITARVCNHPCQDNCSRLSTDESVSIANVERSMGDHILENADKFYATPMANTGKKVAVVGSGPAGLSAAFYLRKIGHQVTVYDKMDEAGGLLTYAIPSYRLPKKYVQQLVAALQGMGVEFLLNTNVGEDITVEELEKDYDKVFLATGAWKRPVLGFDGEEFTEFGLEFLIQVKQWMDKKERNTVLVTGGGNVAMDVAITAKRMGVENVILACLESECEMPASKEEIARAREEGIEIMPSYGISRALYKGDKITGMELRRCVSVFDGKCRFAPQYDEDEKVMVEADSVLMAVGQEIDLSFLGEKYDLALSSGLIKVKEDTQLTSRPGIYAGGDVTTGPSTVIHAVRAGRNAARHINKGFGFDNNNNHREERGFLTFSAEGIKKATAARLKELPANDRCLDKEDSYSLDWEATQDEASRCMNCGCYSVNASDISPVLVALDASIITTKRTIPAADLLTQTPLVGEVLEKGELVTDIEIPACDNYVVHYDKLRMRKSIDFAIVSLASAYEVKEGKIADARLVLGGVAPVPIRLREVEKYLKGKKVTKKVAEEAGKLACDGAVCMSENAYKLQEIMVLVKNSLLALIG